MEQERRSLRVGLAVIACAVVFRLLSTGVLEPVAAFLTSPQTASFLMYLETGRVVRYAPPVPGNDGTQPPEAPTAGEASTQPPTETPPEPTRPESPDFSPEDADLISLSNRCGYDADIETMLLSPLEWDLTQPEPAVLIVHTHGTESYTRAEGEDYTESSNYRTLDDGYNMVSIGDRVAELLEAGGVTVIHDRTPHDYPSYNDAYDNARLSIEDYLSQYPSIRMVLDIHRDAADTGNGQLRTEATVDGEDSAQLMMVVGTDASGLYHPGWPENMALAIKLTALLEKTWPGLTRPISFRSQRFNQDLSAGALIVEVGAAGNSHDEALTAAGALAKAVLALAKGTDGDG